MVFESDTYADYELKLSGELDVQILKAKTDLDSSLRWCNFVLKPKFYKWCLNEDYSTEKIKSSQNYSNTSLCLIDIEKYNELYNALKKKYSEHTMKLWNDADESTDPLKFIHEDLAIAAYLITFWNSNSVSQSPRAFADLGCGNGLLVYILIKEGYKGYGYDVRKRKLWSLYSPEVALQLHEQAVEPFDFTLPADVDWLIGNHSDELSPWIPVLAAICHQNINFFLLPCCAFEFSGNKFQRRNSSVSGYKNFCDYAEQVSNICGFETKRDRLKIPSTKRNALIGLNHLKSGKDFIEKTERIKEFVKNEQYNYPNSSLAEIKLREKTIAVRNCTQIAKSIIDSLVKEIFFLLLETSSEFDGIKKDIKASDWQSGGRLTMSEIAKSLDKGKLKKIKSEYGGLKTLLRNKHEIFQFQQPDFVLIRKPKHQIVNSCKPQTIRKRECFFKLFHPQGCPLKDSECTFLH